jgi:hypothetical protein
MFEISLDKIERLFYYLNRTYVFSKSWGRILEKSVLWDKSFFIIRAMIRKRRA